MGTTRSDRFKILVVTASVLLGLMAGGCGSGTLADKKSGTNPGVPTPTPTPAGNPSASPTPTPPSPAPSPSPAPIDGIPHSSHVVLIIEENTSYSTTVANMPWLVSQGDAYAHATNYMSDTTGSLMDYLWLASGSCHASSAQGCTLPASTNNFGCNGNDCTSPITDDSIWAEMDKLGISWKVYAQSYAAAGGKVTTPDLANGTHYYRRHNGATWYAEILNNVDNAQSKIVDFSQFAVDVAANALPQFIIIAPDGLHDAHDGSPAQADSFLQSSLPSMLGLPDFQPGGDGLLIVTFDNGDADNAGLVYTAFIGPNVKRGYVSNTPYKHEDTLRTILDALRISNRPGASATATPMTDFFQ